MQAKTHNAYVVRLNKAVLMVRRFASDNPNYNPSKPCVYVGLTGLRPEQRFARHKSGVQANQFVRDYGIALMPRLFRRFNPMTYEHAKTMEVELARRLPKRGYAVWQR